MKAKRILIFNVNWLGDVIFSTAAIRNIRGNFPDSFVACIIPLRCRQVLENNPYLDEIIIFDEKSQKGILEKLKFARFIREKKFDTAFLFHRSFSRALILRLARIPERIGYFTKKRSFLLTKAIMPPKNDSLHRIDYYLDIIEKAGLKVKDRFTDFFCSEADEKNANDFLNKNMIHKDDLLIGINPGGNWLPKRWPVPNWINLCNRLRSEFDLKLVITGSPLDLGLINEMQSSLKQKAIVAAGALDIKQFGVLCKRLDIFISSDSGPLHIANAVSAKKIIALFGPTDHLITGPFPASNTVILRKPTGCKIPCYNINCKDNRCMKAITVEMVISNIKNQISNIKI